MSSIGELNERLHGFSCVVGLHLDIERESLKYNLILTLDETEAEGVKKFVICFYDVSELSLAEFGGGFTQFMHLKIEKDHSGYDRKNYRLSELEYENIHFAFADYDILS